MAHLIDPPIVAPPNTVKVAVDFYDEDEKQLLLKSAAASLLSDFPKTIETPTPDLCTYFLYYKKRPGVLGYDTHGAVANRWESALAEFDGQIEFSNSSIRVVQASDLNTGTTEKIGEAVGLSVSSAIHGLHQADWRRIPKGNVRKLLDFWHPWTASDGKQFIQVETKGVTTSDNEFKTPASNARGKIKAKKRDATAEERKSSILYGTISVLGESPNSTARCWLVDPPAGVLDDPLRFKAVTRLEYIAELITFLAARSILAAALQTRLASLRALADIGPLDRVPLRKGNGEPFSTDTFDRSRQHNPWFQGKSVVTDGPVGGHVFVVNDVTVLFIGIQEQLVAYAAEQDFSVLRRYAFPFGTVLKQVECVVPAGRFESEFLTRIDIPEDEQSTRGGYMHFTMEGNLHYSQSGLVFGALPIPESWRRS